MAQWLAEYREQHGLTQTMMAELLGTSRSTITMVEQHKRHLRKKAKEKYQELLAAETTQSFHQDSYEHKHLLQSLVSTPTKKQENQRLKAEFYLIVNKRKLEILKQKEDNALKSLRLLAKFQSHISDPDDIQKRRAAILQRDLIKKFKTQLRPGIEKVQRRVERLEGEARSHRVDVIRPRG